MTGREIVLGVTGGIAAYKAAALASQLVQAGAGVTAVFTAAAEKFIGRATFEALTGRRVLTHVFDEPGHPLGAHIELAEQGNCSSSLQQQQTLWPRRRMGRPMIS